MTELREKLEALDKALIGYHQVTWTGEQLARTKALADAADAVVRATRAPIAAPTGDALGEAVGADVRRLVFAAREIVFSNHRPTLSPETRDEVELMELFANLDAATEAFAERVQWSASLNALPPEYYIWLSSIEDDVRVRDLTDSEALRLIATLTSTEARNG